MESDPPPSNFISLPILFAAIAVLLLLSLLFSISESSFLAVNKLRLRIKRENGDKRATLVSKLLNKKELLINSLLVANDMTNILLSSILTATSVRIFGASGVAYATFVATVLLLVFGEITPKTISTRHADSIAYALSEFVAVVVAVFRPVSVALTAVAAFFLRFFGVNIHEKYPSYTEEEIRTFIDYSSEKGVIDEGANAIMRRIFKFADLEAQSIMTPRTEIVALPQNVSYAEILATAKKTSFSRFPIYSNTIDNIVGVLYLKDLLAVSDAGENFSVGDVMREPIFVLGTKKMSAIRLLLRENWQTLAIVVDEYSGTDGILTQEDISARIFSHTSDFVVNNEFTVDGAILLSDISEKIGVQLESDINETLGGWLEEKLDRLAAVNDVVDYGGWHFLIQGVDMRRVSEVHISVSKADEAEK